MKHIFFTFLGTACLILSGCSNSSHSFDSTDLNPEIYQGYWAMQPVNEQHLVVKFQPNGQVTIYDYICNGNDSYSLNQTETVYLSKIAPQRFRVLDSKKQPYSQLEITQLNTSRMQAKQYFEKQMPLMLNYIHLPGAKPLC